MRAKTVVDVLTALAAVASAVAAARLLNVSRPFIYLPARSITVMSFALALASLGYLISEYLLRFLEETRKRPPYIVEGVVE